MTGEDAELEACSWEMTGSYLVLKCASPKRFYASSQIVTENAYGLRHVCLSVLPYISLPFLLSLSIRLSARINSASTGRFFGKFYT